jgi:hypothetical protein
VLASIPLSHKGLHLMRLNGRRSYNFPDEAAAREHYDTIHRVSIGEPACAGTSGSKGTKQLGVSPGARSPAARRQELPAPSLVLLAVPRPP